MSTAVTSPAAGPAQSAPARRSAAGLGPAGPDLGRHPDPAVLDRAISGAQDITSSGTAGAALRLAVPILLAGMAGLWSERAGVVNIGIEGMMVLGSWCGAYVALDHGPWAGIVAGAVGGALGGLLHAVATVTFGVDHIVSGVAINLLGPGVARFLSSVVFTNREGGGVTQCPQVQQPGTFTVPGLSDGSPRSRATTSW